MSSVYGLFRLDDNVKKLVKDITSTQEFEQEVLNSDNPVLVDFWAAWCGPCRMVGPIVDELSEEYGDRVNFVKINVDENGKLAQRYNISSIPTIAIFKGGKIVKQKMGASSKGFFKTMIDSQVN